jgi:hypothetical protein
MGRDQITVTQSVHWDMRAMVEVDAINFVHLDIGLKAGTVLETSIGSSNTQYHVVVVP